MPENDMNINEAQPRRMTRRDLLRLGRDAAVIGAVSWIGGVACGPDGKPINPQPGATASPTEPAKPTEVVRDPNSLREIATRRGVNIGSQATVDSLRYYPPGAKKDFARVLKEEFNSICIDDFSWGGKFAKQRPLRPSRDEYNFSGVDSLIDFAKSNQMSIQAQSLVWGNPNSLPEWLLKGSFSKEELKTILKEHIATVMRHVRERAGEDMVISWGVVNEHFQSPDNFWYSNLGEEVVDLAFQTAREADSKAVLYLNNGIGNEVVGPVSTDDLARVKRLKSKGLIDGYGMHMHLKGDSIQDLNSLGANIDRFMALGVEVDITEFDVDMTAAQGTKDDKIQKEVKIYSDVLRVLLDKNVKNISFFGMNDALTWLGSGSLGTLLDGSNEPKATFAAIKDVLRAVPEVKRNTP